MWRGARTGMLVAAVATVLLVSGHLRGGDDTAANAEAEVPSFSVEVMVGPLSGPMKIPPANPPSKPYAAFVRIQDSEIGGLWSLPRQTMYAGDSVEEKGSYGPYLITCTVKIDEGGELAAVQIEYVRVDGAQPIQAGIQRFAAHLPRSQMLPD